MAARTRQTKCVHLEHFILVHLTQPLSHTLKHTWAQQRKRRKRRRRERSAGPFSGIQAFEREYSHFMSEVEYLASILNIWECFNNHSAQYHSPRSPEQSRETLFINVNLKKTHFSFIFKCNISYFLKLFAVLVKTAESHLLMLSPRILICNFKDEPGVSFFQISIFFSGCVQV